jgi:transposase
MTDDATTAGPLASSSYDGRKSGSGSRPDCGVEVRVRQVRRRNWSTADRLRIVRETLAPSVVVQAVADRHGISTGQLYTWRKQMLATAMSGFVPVAVVPDAPPVSAPAPSSELAIPDAPATIEIVLPSGASIRATGGADAAVLRMVLAELGGR